MIGWLSAVALAAPCRLDRVDVLSDDPGHWWLDDAPLLPYAPVTTAARFAAQVQPVIQLPHSWYVGLSLSAQDLRHEWDTGNGWWSVLGISTDLGLPRGGLGGLAWREGPVRVGLTLAVLSGASWADLRWNAWTVQPALALGVVNPVRAPWLKRVRSPTM